MDTFQVLAEPTRRHIVEMVSQHRILTATDIGNKFDSSLAAISQHLKILREGEVLHMEKQGRRRLYSVNPKAILEVEDWVKKTKNMWNDRFDRLEKVLEKEKLKLKKKVNKKRKNNKK